MLVLSHHHGFKKMLAFLVVGGLKEMMSV